MAGDKSINYSVVIPVGPNDDSWFELIEDLQSINCAIEIILAATQEVPSQHQGRITKSAKVHPTLWLDTCSKGRPQQLNSGANAAAGKWLLFLHADSRITQSCFDALKTVTKTEANHLFYFNLEFENRRNPLLRLTEFGVRIRCLTWGMPYGDQGFAIQREKFQSLKGFPILDSGEDHAFAWLCQNSGISPKRLPESIRTSSRKYQKHGWIKVAVHHNLLGMKQAIKFRNLKLENLQDHD